MSSMSCHLVEVLLLSSLNLGMLNVKMNTMMSGPLLRLKLLLFPFWCFDAKGGEESIYLPMVFMVLFGFGL
jgi:hypothetical protein